MHDPLPLQTVAFSEETPKHVFSNVLEMDLVVVVLEKQNCRTSKSAKTANVVVLMFIRLRLFSLLVCALLERKISFSIARASDVGVNKAATCILPIA